jgi:hypothetical protein
MIQTCLILGYLGGITQGFIPQRTPERDLLFFGVESPASAFVVTNELPAKLPPASAYAGVNRKDSTDHDLSDYGTLGVPDDVMAERKARAEEAAAGGLSASKFLLFQSSHKATTGLGTIKRVLDLVSVLWLIGLIVGCYFFLKTAFSHANRKVTFSLGKSKDDTGIDRESYVYVDGG